MSDVIQIGDFLMRRKRESSYPVPGECKHLRVEIDDKGQIVTCQDCKVQVQPFWALTMLAEQWYKMESKLKCREQRLRDAESKGVELRAAQRVEEAWRKRKMVPSCPHCNRGILPTDGFSSNFVNREMEQRRREIERSAKP